MDYRTCLYTLWRTMNPENKGFSFEVADSIIQFAKEDGKYENDLVEVTVSKENGIETFQVTWKCGKVIR